MGVRYEYVYRLQTAQCGVAPPSEEEEGEEGTTQPSTEITRYSAVSASFAQQAETRTFDLRGWMYA